MNKEEESSEGKNLEAFTTIVLSSEPIFSLHKFEETTIDFPTSPASPSSG